MNKDSLATGVILAVLLALVILFARYTVGVLPSSQLAPSATSSKPIPPASQFTLPAMAGPFTMPLKRKASSCRRQRRPVVYQSDYQQSPGGHQ